jgi:hypothetical protein
LLPIDHASAVRELRIPRDFLELSFNVLAAGGSSRKLFVRAAVAQTELSAPISRIDEYGRRQVALPNDRSTPMRSGLSIVLTRLATVLAVLLVTGLVLRLITAVLAPVLPARLMQALSAGWDTLLGLMSPALPSIVAMAILGLGCWILIGKR